MRSYLVALAAVVAGAVGLGALSVPPASAESGWRTVTSWQGGLTRVCAAPNGDGTSKVKAYWDGRNYPIVDGEFRDNGAGGLAHVSSGFAISGWTYSSAGRGDVGATVSITRPTDGWVYVLSGSAVGITVEAIVPVATLPTCPGSGRVAAPAATTERTSGAAERGRKCVTKREFRRIKKGMRPARVKRVVGASGKAVTTAEYSQVRRYHRCGSKVDVVVNFKRAKARKPLQVRTRYQR